MFTFVSNNPADFDGGAYQTTRAGSFRSSRVSRAIEMHGTAGTLQTRAIHGFTPVAGSVTWVHAQVGFFGSSHSAPQDHSNADGNMLFAARDASGAIVAEFTVLNGKLRIRAYGSSTADSADYSLTNLSSSTLYALDVKTRLADHFGVSVSYLVGEDRAAPDADDDLVRMFRQAQELDPADRKILDDLLQSFLRRKQRAG